MLRISQNGISYEAHDAVVYTSAITRCCVDIIVDDGDYQHAEHLYGDDGEIIITEVK